MNTEAEESRQDSPDATTAPYQPSPEALAAMREHEARKNAAIQAALSSTVPPGQLTAPQVPPSPAAPVEGRTPGFPPGSVAGAPPASTPAPAGGGPYEIRVPYDEDEDGLPSGGRAAGMQGLHTVRSRNHALPPREKLEDFLAASCVMRCREALKATGLDWSQISNLMCRDKEFEKAYAAAQDMFDVVVKMRLKDRIVELALEGFKMPVFQEGAVVGYRVCHDMKAIQMLAHKHARGEYEELSASSQLSISARHGTDGQGRSLDEIIVAIEQRTAPKV